MKVWIDRNERWPVYGLDTNPAHLLWNFAQDEIVEMSEEDFSRLSESWRIAKENFVAVQKEIGDIYEAHMKKTNKK